MVDATNNSGILAGEDDILSYYFKTGPVSGLTVNNNIVNNAMEYGIPTMSTIIDAAAITSYVTDLNSNYVTTQPDSNFSITGNLITNTMRSGVRVDSLNGGAIAGNTILNSSLDTTDYVQGWGISSGETLAQVEADFAQSVVAINSTGVANSGNVTTGSLVASVSDASGGDRLAPGSIASAYGSNLAPSIMSATATPLPTSLGGVTVIITDNTGTARPAGLFFVSPDQVNYQVPAGTAAGVAKVTIGNSVGGTLIGAVAPGLFSADGTGGGVAAAVAVSVAANGTQTPVSVFQCAAGGCVSTPMSLGAAGSTLVVELYGTGIEGYSSLTNVVASVNGVPATVLYAGALAQYPGLDQVNVIIPSSLAGAGEVPVVLTVDGQTANVVTINIQ